MVDLLHREGPDRAHGPWGHWPVRTTDRTAGGPTVGTAIRVRTAAGGPGPPASADDPSGARARRWPAGTEHVVRRHTTTVVLVVGGVLSLSVGAVLGGIADPVALSLPGTQHVAANATARGPPRLPSRRRPIRHRSGRWCRPRWALPLDRRCDVAGVSVRCRPRSIPVPSSGLSSAAPRPGPRPGAVRRHYPAPAPTGRVSAPAPASTPPGTTTTPSTPTGPPRTGTPAPRVAGDVRRAGRDDRTAATPTTVPTTRTRRRTAAHDDTDPDPYDPTPDTHTVPPSGNPSGATGVAGWLGGLLGG